MKYIIILCYVNKNCKMNIKAKPSRKRIGHRTSGRKALVTRRRTRFNRLRIIRARVRRNRTLKKILKPVPEPLPVAFVLKDMSVERLTLDEINKCNTLLSGCFAGDIDVSQIKIDNTCVFGMLGNELITFMCIQQSPLETTDQNDSKLIHTVCTSERYRGRGLLKQMFHWVASTPKYRDAFFHLEAADTNDNGLNQTARFRIYSKTGFVLKIGTKFRPCNDMVKLVRIKPEIREITYRLIDDAGTQRWTKPDEMEMDGCHRNAQEQINGCWMVSNAAIMREFNNIH
jgi:hypothetical protein